MAKKAHSRRKFALSRKYQRFFAAAGVATVASLVGVAGYNIVIILAVLMLSAPNLSL